MNIKMHSQLFNLKKKSAATGSVDALGEKLDPDHVLTEYPRPQMQIFLHDSQRVLGIRHNRKSQAAAGLRRKNPAPFFSRNDSLRRRTPINAGRISLVPQKDQDRCCSGKQTAVSQFRAVDEEAAVFLNGIMVKEHSGGYLSFSAELHRRCKRRSQYPVHQSTGFQRYFGKPRQTKACAWRYVLYGQSGIWQTVWLEWTPVDFIRELKITPLFDSGMSVSRSLLHLFIPGEITVCGISAKAVSGKPCLIHIKELHPWSPEDPFLSRRNKSRRRYRILLFCDA